MTTPAQVLDRLQELRQTARAICSVDGCNRPVNSRGLCNTHYSLVRKGGTIGVDRRKKDGPKVSPYIWVWHNGRRIGEHILIAEKIIGRQLPTGAEVHHVNENKSDNRHENLVICPSVAYHKLLHQRMRARELCGNPNYRMCRVCKKWDDPANLYICGTTVSHRSCEAERARNRYALAALAEGK